MFAGVPTNPSLFSPKKPHFYAPPDAAKSIIRLRLEIPRDVQNIPLKQQISSLSTPLLVQTTRLWTNHGPTMADKKRRSDTITPFLGT